MRSVSCLKFIVPRVLIAGPYTGVGKTTVAIGLMAAMRRRGLRVQGFKVGPDYIDPGYHGLATGRPPRNLDTWMIPCRRVPDVLVHGANDADVAVIEGVMGFYDGAGGGERASTEEMAKLLLCPVILVVDTYTMSRSAGALVLGYQTFDPQVWFGGVILNRVAGERHKRWCIDAIRRHCKLSVLGAIPFKPEIALPERHLGLVPTQELAKTMNEKVELIRRVIEEACDIQGILKLMDSAPPISVKKGGLFSAASKEPPVRVGVAIDESFNFYYQENLDLLQCFGAQIVPFSPLKDPEPPDVDGLLLGGGFPEVLPGALEANSSMRRSLLKLAEDGMPIYAECGGLMYLTRSIRGYDGRNHRMVGLIPGDTVMTRQLTIGYTRAKAIRDNLISAQGWALRGHEFHYSKVFDVPSDTRFAYELDIGRGIVEGRDGYLVYRVLASYMHTHFAQRRNMAERFVVACREFSRR